MIALVFETVYNVTNARMYWESVYAMHDGYDKGNIDYAYGGYSKVDEDYEDYLPLKRKQLESYNGLHRKQALPDYTDYIYYSDYSDSDNSWRRSGDERDEENHGLEEEVNISYKRDWRYVLGLPPWFLKT